MVPSVFGLALWIPQLVLIGPEMFTSETLRLESSMLLSSTLMILGLGQMVLGIWSLVLLCHTVAEVQAFRSAWRGFANVLLSALVFLGVIIAIVLLAVVIATAVDRVERLARRGFPSKQASSGF
jgi:hypothetical protein